ncbi:unnamed protein product [Ectocarpus fasciculatus]
MGGSEPVFGYPHADQHQPQDEMGPRASNNVMMSWNATQVGTHRTFVSLQKHARAESAHTTTKERPFQDARCCQSGENKSSWQLQYMQHFPFSKHPPFIRHLFTPKH